MHFIKKHFCESNNFFDSLKPLYWTLKLFGLTPFHLNFQNGIINTTFWDFLMFCCINSFQFVIIIIFVHEVISSYIENSILDAGWDYQLTYQAIITFGIVLHNFWKRKNIETFLRVIHKFDEFLLKVNWKYSINHTNNRCKLCCWLILSFLCYIISYLSKVFFLFLNMDITGHYKSFCYFYISQVNLMTSYIFILSIYSVDSRMNCLIKNAG